jgi:hypothetical protein
MIGKLFLLGQGENDKIYLALNKNTIFGKNSEEIFKIITICTCGACVSRLIELKHAYSSGGINSSYSSS